MRNLMLVCAGLALFSGVVAVNLWRELRAERVLTAELRTQLNGGQAATWAPASGGMQAAPLPASGSVPTPGTEVRSEQLAAAAEGARPPAQTAQIADVARLVLNQQEMMKDPEYRKARLAQTRMSLPQNYPGLAEELGLTPEEADRLFNLLAENQMEMTDLSMTAATINGVAPDPAAMEEVNRRRPEMQRRQEEALMSMLGSAKYSQYQEYQQTRAPRQQVVQLNRALEGIGLPLTPEQSKPLTAAYIAEQKRQRDEQRAMFTARGPQDAARMQEERFELQAESNRRILEAARPHLNSQQLETMKASLDQQLAMNRATQRMIRQQQDAQGQAPAPAGGTVISIIGSAPLPVIVP
jgi:hypothetical protein